MTERPAANGEQWDADGVRALRVWLDDSQSALADRIGTRQQTVSEWETGSSRPRRMSRRLLQIVAEEAGFYDAGRATTTATERETAGSNAADGTAADPEADDTEAADAGAASPEAPDIEAANRA